jgi:hypothetical protein
MTDVQAADQLTEAALRAGRSSGYRKVARLIRRGRLLESIIGELEAMASTDDQRAREILDEINKKEEAE